MYEKQNCKRTRVSKTTIKKNPANKQTKKVGQMCYYIYTWIGVFAEHCVLMWINYCGIGWPHMVTVFSAFLQLHAGPTPPPPWLHAGHMPSVWTVSKWLHMRSVWPRGSVCRSPLPPNQKQEPARSGPVGGWRSPGRSLTGFHRHSHSFLTNLYWHQSQSFVWRGPSSPASY